MKKMSTKSSADVNDWQAESDLCCLMDAKKIQADPKRMKKVQELARKKLESVAMVLGEASESE